MSRPSRHVLPDVPLHIYQRGVNRAPTFLDPDDYGHYRQFIFDASRDARCAVHAYVLMTNHIHLLVTPADVTGPACMMSKVNKRYVRYFNDRFRRTGALWSGRYRSALVDSASYLFICHRYIEMNPVRCGLTDDPAAYEWSSHRGNARAENDPLLSPHPLYASLGESTETRCAAYRAMFDSPLSAAALTTIRTAHRQRPRLQLTPYDEAVRVLTEGAN